MGRDQLRRSYEHLVPRTAVFFGVYVVLLHNVVSTIGTFTPHGRKIVIEVQSPFDLV